MSRPSLTSPGTPHSATHALGVPATLTCSQPLQCSFLPRGPAHAVPSAQTPFPDLGQPCSHGGSLLGHHSTAARRACPAPGRGAPSSQALLDVHSLASECTSPFTITQSSTPISPDRPRLLEEGPSEFLPISVARALSRGPTETGAQRVMCPLPPRGRDITAFYKRETHARLRDSACSRSRDQKGRA